MIAAAERKAEQKVQQTFFRIKAQSQSEILKRKRKILDKVYGRALDKIREIADA